MITAIECEPKANAAAFASTCLVSLDIFNSTRLRRRFLAIACASFSVLPVLDEYTINILLQPYILPSESIFFCEHVHTLVKFGHTFCKVFD